MEEAQIRIGTVLAGHIIWLSVAALRFRHSGRTHWITAPGSWVIGWYPSLVWLPLLVAFFVRPWRVALAPPAPTAGLILAVASALFAAWAMWSLGRAYGVRMDLFEGHRLKTDGPYRLVRHPMYLGIIGYHFGASFALESGFLLAVTVLLVAPYTVLRSFVEDRVLAAGFGEEFERYRSRTPSLLPLA